tara:strand:- start:692 stop:1312 length:621 start_codon:yes stop_codon:yes gene_type:complete
MAEEKYKIIGRPGAGSLIAEFLFKELEVSYEVEFVQPGNNWLIETSNFHPQGKIPLLICPDGNSIYETLAIVNHIIDRFNKLAPERGTYQYDRFWQFLSLFATSLYPGYHRQHHSRYYIGKDSFGDLSKRAREEQATIYDYVESEISPFVCGKMLTAADFYLYMLMRWDLEKAKLYASRPNLKEFSNQMRNRESVQAVLNGQLRKN